MIAVLFVLAALLASVMAAPLVDGACDRWRLRRRVAAMPVRRGPAARQMQSTTAPIRRAEGRASDARIARWLPAGEAIAAQLAGSRVSLTMLTGGATLAALALAAGVFSLGLPIIVAAPLLPMIGFAIIIRALHAGLPIGAAIAEVARSGSGPVAKAFGTVTEAMRLGQPLDTALWLVAHRIGLAEFDFFVVTIALQRETGGNLAETLAGLDTTLRMRRQLAMKVRAMAAEARASATIIGSLPFVMALLLWVTSPAYLVPLFTTVIGKAMVGVGLASIAVGALIISQLMQVKA